MIKSNNNDWMMNKLQEMTIKWEKLSHFRFPNAVCKLSSDWLSRLQMFEKFPGRRFAVCTVSVPPFSNGEEKAASTLLYTCRSYIFDQNTYDLLHYFWRVTKGYHPSKIDGRLQNLTGEPTGSPVKMTGDEKSLARRLWVALPCNH